MTPVSITGFLCVCERERETWRHTKGKIQNIQYLWVHLLKKTKQNIFFVLVLSSIISLCFSFVHVTVLMHFHSYSVSDFDAYELEGRLRKHWIRLILYLLPDYQELLEKWEAAAHLSISKLNSGIRRVCVCVCQREGEVEIEMFDAVTAANYCCKSPRLIERTELRLNDTRAAENDLWQGD